MAKKVAPRISSAESQGTWTQADRGLGCGEVDTLVERPAHLQMNTLGLDSC